MIPFGVSNLINIRTFSTTKDLLLTDNNNNNPEEDFNVTSSNNNNTDENSNITSSNNNNTDASGIAPEDTNTSDAEHANNDFCDNTSWSDISEAFDRLKDQPYEELENNTIEKSTKIEAGFEEDTDRNEYENRNNPDELKIRQEEINSYYQERREALEDRDQILENLISDYQDNLRPLSPKSSDAESSSENSLVQPALEPTSDQEQIPNQISEPEQKQTPEQTLESELKEALGQTPEEIGTSSQDNKRKRLDSDSEEERETKRAKLDPESNIDFVLEKKETEMPDIFDIDGGE